MSCFGQPSSDIVYEEKTFIFGSRLVILVPVTPVHATNRRGKRHDAFLSENLFCLLGRK